MKRFILTAATVTTVAFSSVTPALAATTNNDTGQALEIAPPVITLTVNPGQKVTTQISLRDIVKGDLVVTGQANDFVAAGEDGTPKILIDNKETDPYSLKNWVSPLPTLLMHPQKIMNMPVVINVPKNASPGGHYGVIRFTATPPDLKGQGVSLSASLGALVLLTVRGDIKDQLAVQEFSTNKDGHKGHLFESTPINFVERIKNTGNVHEQPRGLITIKDMFGKVVANVGVNQSVRNILPGSTRMFTQPLDKTGLGTRKLFGRYTATMVLTYGPKKQTLTAKTTFWIIPYRLIAVVVILLIAGFFFVRRLIRRHDERVMKRMQRMQHQNRRPPGQR